jgi:integrase
MHASLISREGRRKYLTTRERAAFIAAAARMDPSRAAFCLTLALTGARISEVLMLTWGQLDEEDGTVLLQTLKRRRKDVYRAVPAPPYLFLRLKTLRRPDNADLRQRLWPVSRPTAWKYVKAAMCAANVSPELSTPRALRHAFAVEAVQRRISLNVIQKWLGHAKIETTAIYADAVGEEERLLAESMWSTLPANA